MRVNKICWVIVTTISIFIVAALILSVASVVSFGALFSTFFSDSSRPEIDVIRPAPFIPLDDSPSMVQRAGFNESLRNVINNDTLSQAYTKEIEGTIAGLGNKSLE